MQILNLDVMDGNLSMQNNISGEEPASYFQRVYGLNRTTASKYETAYCMILECGANLSMNEFMGTCNVDMIPLNTKLGSHLRA